jgi:hypothetical protein
MIETVEAVIDERGVVRLLQPVRVPVARRALVTILEEKPTLNVTEAALLRDSAPAEAWIVPRDDMRLLLRETAAWDAASDEDALKIEKLLAEMK